MLSHYVFTLLMLCCTSSFSTAKPFNSSCGDGIIRGVNLGGWLNMEPWITPSIFQEVNVGENKNKIVDEYTYAQYVDPDYRKERLNRLWDEFYVEEDIQTLAANGISHIRIPVGYWIWDVAEDEPFPAPPANDDEGQRFYLKRLLKWAENAGLKVLIDLHTAPGSQNGFDNSGRRGPVRWLEGDNVERTVRILEKITQNMADWITEGHIKEETLYGIELLNEPAGWDQKLWETCRDSFYPDGYDLIRNVFPQADPQVVIQQAFKSFEDFHDYMNENDGVSLDWHEYQCFGDYWNQLADQPTGWTTHLEAARNWGDDARTLPIFTGEWSLAVTDCQLYLDGGWADPYDPVASDSACAYYNSDFSTYPEEYKDFLKEFFIAQSQGYENKGVGWFFWTGKTENNCAPEWDYLYLLEKGIISKSLC